MSKLLKHPLTVAIFSGVILAFLGFQFEKRNKVRELRILEIKSKIDQDKKYLDELALASSYFYGAVENYILDNIEGNETGVRDQIQKVNYARAPLFAVLEKIKISSIVDETNRSKISEYYNLVINITTLCQTRRTDKRKEVRRLLDSKFTPMQNFILSEIQKHISRLETEEIKFNP